MSDMQESDLPGNPGTKEGETGPSESDPKAPSADEPQGGEGEGGASTS